MYSRYKMLRYFQAPKLNPRIGQSRVTTNFDRVALKASQFHLHKDFRCNANSNANFRRNQIFLPWDMAK